MRTLCIFTVSLIFALQAIAQSTSITVEEYDKAYQFALTETNQRFPFVHTFTSQRFRNGTLVSESIHVAERQASGVERQTFTTVENGKTTVSYQLRTDHDNNVYCSFDGKSWTVPQLYECPRSIRIYRPNTPASTEYSVEETTVGGKKVKSYHKFEVFGTSPTTQTFSEEISLIDSDGLFISTTHTMGRLRNTLIDTKMTNSWSLNAKFGPITVPRNLKPSSKKSTR